jgi:oligoendopeptidase F
MGIHPAHLPHALLRLCLRLRTLLVLSLYQQYRAEGAAFKPRYLQILAAGGSDSPERILQRAGIDMRSKAFWQGGFDVVAASLRKLDAIEAGR